MLSWNATQNTDFYSVWIYDAGDNLIYQRDDYMNTAFAALLPAGSYQAKVCSVRRNIWVTEGDRVAFTVTTANPTHIPDIQSLNMVENKLYKLYACEGTWLEEKALAEAEGGRLAIVNSQTIQDCISQMVYDFGQIVYLGAEGYSRYFWVWSDGSKVEGYTNWDGNKPDNWQGLENCLVMYPSNGSWEDYPCADNSVHGYVAEFDMIDLAVEPIDEVWLEGVDSVRDNLQVFATFADGSSVLFTDYELSTVEENGVLMANVSYAGFTASCTVNLSKPITSITLSPSASTLVLLLEERQKITANIEPVDATNQTLTWASSDENVVTIHNNWVVPHNSGTEIITASAMDGSRVVGTCEITVLEDFYLNRYTLYLATSGIGSAYQLEATMQPADLACEIRFYSSDTFVVRVTDDGLVSAVGIGTAIITIEITNGSSTNVRIQVKDMGQVSIPGATQIIDEEAFCRDTMERVVISDSTERICSRAFADNNQLRFVLIPNSVTYIAPDAFSDDTRVCILCGSGSYAEQWAIENGVDYMINDAEAEIEGDR